MHPIHDRIILRSLLLALGIGNDELRGGTFAGMLRGRGAEFRLAGEDGRVWIMAIVPCDRCGSYHESEPIADAGQITDFVRAAGGACPN